MIDNTILTANGAGRKALVFSLTYKDLWAVEAAAQAGFDAVALDGEHGAFGAADVDDIVRVANGYGMSVMARVPNIQPSTLNLWLDRGIQGIVGPHIETQAEAQQLADACLFPPDGRRSWGTPAVIPAAGQARRRLDRVRGQLGDDQGHRVVEGGQAPFPKDVAGMEPGAGHGAGQRC